MTRLKDIAEKAGVSVMTVSKVLRDAPDISAATKVRIRKLADELGYVPDTLAQGLRTRTTRSIGLVISTVTNPIFARSILAIDEHCFELGYDLILAQSLGAPEREEAVIRRLLSRRVDGLIISPVHRLSQSAPIFVELAAARIPVVILGHKAPFCAQFTNVETDDLHGSSAAAAHLLNLGHRKIVHLAGPAAAPWALERLDGYRRALREAMVEVDDRLIFTAGSTIEDGQNAALQLLNEGVEFSAIHAANDLIAIGAGTVLLQQGVKIPEQISLTGFGNILLGEHFAVPLTTVRQAKFRLGSAAMESLRKLLRHELPESKRLHAELLIRQSTAHHPSR